MHVTPVLVKKNSFHNFLNRSNFAFNSFFSKKKIQLKNCLCHVYVYAVAFTRAVHLVRVFLDHFLRTRLVWVFLKQMSVL